MYRLFVDQPYRGVKISPVFNKAARKLDSNIDKVISYYMSNPTFVPNEHPIVKLLAGLTVDLEQSDEILHRQIYNRRDSIAAGVGISTTRNKGEMHPYAFYCKNCMLVGSEFGDVLEITSWVNISAVRPLTHPVESLQPTLPNQIKLLNNEDYAVIGVDIPLLAVQYKHWLIHEMRKPAIERNNTAHFVSKYVFSTMIFHHMVIVLRNRYLAEYSETYRNDVMPKIPLHLEDLERYFDAGMEEIIFDINLSGRTFSEAMVRMPMLEGLTYNQMVPTTGQSLSLYSYWTTFLVYLDWAYPIFVVADRLDPKQETVYRKLKSIKRYLDSVKVMKDYKGFSEVVERKWEHISEIAGL